MTCSRLLSSDACGLILVWDLKNRSVIHKLQGHCKAVPFLFMLRGQNTLASGSHDGTTRLWDMETGFEKAVLDVKVHAGGRAEQTLRSESASRDNCELSLKDNKHTRTVDFRTNIYGFLVLNDGRIIGGGRSGFVHVWDSTSR
jgi:WD40 repeat protein